MKSVIYEDGVNKNVGNEMFLESDPTKWQNVTDNNKKSDSNVLSI